MNHIEQKALAAGKTLEHLGYNWQGGELWEPPLGANPMPLLDRITELEAQLADAKQVANDCKIVADNAIAEALGAKKDSERMDWIIDKSKKSPTP